MKTHHSNSQVPEEYEIQEGEPASPSLGGYAEEEKLLKKINFKTICSYFFRYVIVPVLVVYGLICLFSFILGSNLTNN